MATAATFFSFKGGAGRSTTCLNTIPFLIQKLGANARHPIVLLDTDIDSCGMTYLLGQEQFFRDSEVDIKEFLQSGFDCPEGDVGGLANHPLFKYFAPVGKFFDKSIEDGAVLFLGVDDTKPVERSKIGVSYTTRMSALYNAADNNEARAVIMDSAAGDQFTARLSIDISDNIVVCMRPTSQFRAGTFAYLKRLNGRLGKQGAENRVVLLPTVVPADVEIDGVNQLDAAIADFAEKTKMLGNLSLDTTFVERRDFFGINEIKRFKWQENVLFRLPKETLSDDEKQAMERYSKLAEVIAAYEY